MKQSSKPKEERKILYQTARRSSVNGEHFEPGQEPVRILPYNQATITTKDLAETIAGRCTVKAPDIYAALTALSQVLTETLLSGNRLRVDGIGTFDISLTQKKSYADGRDRPQKMVSDRISAQDVCINRVVFTPASELRHALKRAMFVSSGVFAEEAPSREDIDAFIALHFASEPVLTRSQFEQHFGISRNLALGWIKALIDEGVLRALGPRNSRFYVPVNEH